MKMNKEKFCLILECALLAYDGMGKNEMMELEIGENEINAGIELCNYLKSIKLKNDR